MEEITKQDLDIKICDFYNKSYGDNDCKNEETFREFIWNTETNFELEHEDIDSMDNEMLNGYLNYLDEMWDK